MHALKAQHCLPSQQGIDLIAIYTDNTDAVVAIGESKASQARGGQELTAAAGMFRDIDNDIYGVELRTELSSLRNVLAPELARQITGALWRESRCYLPVIVYETSFDLTTPRPTLGELKPSHDRRRLLALRLSDFHGFFDLVADSMRAAVSEIII